jgi:hypothetical protein
LRWFPLATILSDDNILGLRALGQSATSPLRIEGLISRLNYCRDDDTAWAARNENTVTQLFDYHSIPNSKRINEYAIMDNYLVGFVGLAMYYEKADQKDRARRLLARLVDLIPGIHYRLKTSTMLLFWTSRHFPGAFPAAAR